MTQLLRERRVRLLDVALDDQTAGPAWPDLVKTLRRLVQHHQPSTFSLGPHGERVPLTLGAALHTERVRHFVLDFVS